MEVSVESKTLYILDNVKNCEFMMCILLWIINSIVCIPGAPGNACFQEGAVLEKGVKPFGIGISCCHP